VDRDVSIIHDDVSRCLHIADGLHETGNVSVAERATVNTHINGTHKKGRMYVIADVRNNREKGYRKYTTATQTVWSESTSELYRPSDRRLTAK
jgi:hypothetical protein